MNKVACNKQARDNKLAISQAQSKVDFAKAQSSADNMKAEIANEFGVGLSANTIAKQQGAVGGEITKRLMASPQNKLGKK